MVLRITFPNLGLHLWDKEAISYIASVIGNLLHIDANTLNKKDFISARACIEIDAADSLPDKVPTVTKKG